MNRKAMEVPANVKTAPRAAASHFSGDLAKQARLSVEGVLPRTGERYSKGRFAGFGGNLIDPEIVLCTRWAAAMGQKGAWYE
jgi:hypothetical protein